MKFYIIWGWCFRLWGAERKSRRKYPKKLETSMDLL